ncbi:MAG: FAD-dependent oxidoreductase, partial [Bacilli bacterium]|nr:FAD-dependent oxidoreductase [Bacilli bacterium]
MKQTDVIVIGAGIAGLSAAIYLKRSSLSSILLEKSAPGGTLLNVHKIDNYPGFETIPGPELAEKVFSQAMALGVQYEYGNVASVFKDGDLFEVKTDVETYQAKAVIIAAGIQIPQTGFPGQKEFLGKGISYCATCDGNFYKGKPVAVIGNESRAAEEALYLAGLVSRLDFVSEKPLEIEENLLEQLESKPNVFFHLDAKVLRVEGEGKLQSLFIEEGKEEKR